MNPQGKGKIEWTDFTWSPVTGCKHGCSYCYANRIAQRIYKEKFEPTFRPQRLGEPAKLKKPSKIFVCDMGDLFGEWVPDEWQSAVIKACKENPQHTYQFLTKNPEQMIDWRYGTPPRTWMGTTIENQRAFIMRCEPFADSDLSSCGIIRFASFEPLQSAIELDDTFDWIIIGEETGRALTQEEIHNIWQWAGELIDQAKALDIPVFVKNQLGQTYKQREYPR